MRVPGLSASQKNKIKSLLLDYRIEPDRLLYQIIADLNVQLFGVSFFFKPDFFDSIQRDNKRIERILKIVNEFENAGLKSDFFNTIAPSFKYRTKLPRSDEDRQHIIKRCSTIAEVLQDMGHFKRAKYDLYFFLASLVNILKPNSFSDDELTDGEVRSFRKYLNSKNTKGKKET